MLVCVVVLRCLLLCLLISCLPRAMLFGLCCAVDLFAFLSLCVSRCVMFALFGFVLVCFVLLCIV